MEVATLKLEWEPTFTSYFEKSIKPKIDCCGWWSAKSVGWRGYTDLTIWSRTSNQAEGANNLLRERLEYRGTSIVGLVRNFDDWQGYVLNECARAFMGQGGYRLQPKFAREDDFEQAERLLAKVQGTTTRGQMEGGGVDSNLIPPVNAVGTAKSLE